MAETFPAKVIAPEGKTDWHWHIAFVRSCTEQKTAAAILRHGLSLHGGCKYMYETFVPMLKRRTAEDWLRKGNMAAFPMYVFFKCPDAHTYRIGEDVKNIFAILRKAGRRSFRPDDFAVIDEEKINSLRIVFARCGGDEIIIDGSAVPAGTKVVVRTGRLRGVCGEVRTVSGRSRLQIRIESLGCAAVEIDMKDLAVIE